MKKAAQKQLCNVLTGKFCLEFTAGILKFIQKLLKLQKNQRMIQVTTKLNFKHNCVMGEALQLFFIPCTKVCSQSVSVCVCNTMERIQKGFVLTKMKFPTMSKMPQLLFVCHSV